MKKRILVVFALMVMFTPAAFAGTGQSDSKSGVKCDLDKIKPDHLVETSSPTTISTPVHQSAGK